MSPTLPVQPLQPVLARLDVLDGEQLRQSFAVHAPGRLRIGRSLDCEVCLDDPHLAAEHAVLDIGADPVARLTLQPSHNGGHLGGRVLTQGATVDWPAGTQLELGETRLRLRHAATPLAPERALQTVAGRRPQAWTQLALWVAAALALMLLERWLRSHPGTRWSEWLMPVGLMLSGLLAWAGLWSLLNQLFQRRFPFVQHARAAAGTVALLGGASLLLSSLAFMFSRPELAIVDHWLGRLALAGLVFWHARQVWPRAQRLLIVLVLGVLGWNGLNHAIKQSGQQYRWRPPYLSALLPPAWRVAPLHPVDALLQDARALQAPLAAQAKDDSQAPDEGP